MEFLRAWLTDGGAIEVRPLNDANVATQVGAISVLHGFTIRLKRD